MNKYLSKLIQEQLKIKVDFLFYFSLVNVVVITVEELLVVNPNEFNVLHFLEQIQFL